MHVLPCMILLMAGDWIQGFLILGKYSTTSSPSPDVTFLSLWLLGLDLCLGGPTSGCGRLICYCSWPLHSECKCGHLGKTWLFCLSECLLHGYQWLCVRGCVCARAHTSAHVHLYRLSPLSRESFGLLLLCACPQNTRALLKCLHMDLQP